VIPPKNSTILEKATKPWPGWATSGGGGGGGSGKEVQRRKEIASP